ncbi:MAG: hypothetical protein KKB31_04420 [Nanoarchaeota archaeon]|nr:hypothetical protein [Nanoarchaeota archaeon]
MEEKLNLLLEKLDKIIDEKNGIKLSGQGMIANNTAKANEILDKIQKFLYFMEKRQTAMEEQNKEIISLLKEKFK